METLAIDIGLRRLGSIEPRLDRLFYLARHHLAVQDDAR
jgi:hypothetical protein